MSFRQKVMGVKHSIPVCFIGLLKSLDDYFGELNVSTGHYHHAKTNGNELSMKYIGYDSCRKNHILQARGRGAIQVFYIKHTEGIQEKLEDFLAGRNRGREYLETKLEAVTV